MLRPDMLAFLIWFCFLGSFYVLNSDALPIPISHPTNNTVGSPDDWLPAFNSRAFPLSAAHTITHRHARDFSDVSSQHQAAMVIPFPKYAVALLALFIVVCAISSAIITILLLSKNSPARERISTLASRILSPRARAPTGDKGHGGEKITIKHEEEVLDIADQNTRTSRTPTPTENGDKRKCESTASSSVVEEAETSLTLGNAPDSDDKEKLTASHELSPNASRPSVSLHASSSSESLKLLVKASTKALQRLSNIISPDDTTGIVPSDTSSFTKTGILSNTEAISPSSKASLTPLENDASSDHTSSSQHSTSSTAFYSLADVLSPSMAVYSLVDLAALTNNREYDQATTPDLLEVTEERDITDGHPSPRYVPGEQLETIQEESESFSSMSRSSLARLRSIISNRSKKQLRESGAAFNSSIHEDQVKEETADTRFEATLNDEFTHTRLSASISLTDRIPRTWEELAVDPQNPSLSRFFPAARPAPLPSEPTSAVARVPALRSPYKNEERRHSVAWLSPVIEWAVDDSRESLSEKNTIPPEGEDESEDAQTAADAMAAVMDSLAAIGMDPTHMGLMTEDSISDPFPDSPPPSDMLFIGENAKTQGSTVQHSVEGDMMETKGRNGSDSKSPTGAHPKEETIPQKKYDARMSSLSLSPQELSHSSNAREGLTRAHNIEGSGNPRESNFTRDPDRRRSTGSPLDLGFRTSGTRSKSSSAMGGIGSPSASQTFRTPRSIKSDRVYPSPSSLAGLSPAEVTKRFSVESMSSATGSTPPRDKRPISPPSHFSPVPSLQVRKPKERSFSPTLRSTPSTLTSSPTSDRGSPSPRSQSPLFYRQYMETSFSTPRASSSPRRSTSSNRPLSPRKTLHQSSSSSYSLSQRPKPIAISQVTLSSLILQERSNSMEFV